MWFVGDVDAVLEDAFVEAGAFAHVFDASGDLSGSFFVERGEFDVVAVDVDVDVVWDGDGSWCAFADEVFDDEFVALYLDLHGEVPAAYLHCVRPGVDDAVSGVAESACVTIYDSFRCLVGCWVCEDEFVVA